MSAESGKAIPIEYFRLTSQHSDVFENYISIVGGHMPQFVYSQATLELFRSKVSGLQCARVFDFGANHIAVSGVIVADGAILGAYQVDDRWRVCGMLFNGHTKDSTYLDNLILDHAGNYVELFDRVVPDLLGRERLSQITLATENLFVSASRDYMHSCDSYCAVLSRLLDPESIREITYIVNLEGVIKVYQAEGYESGSDVLPKVVTDAHTLYTAAISLKVLHMTVVGRRAEYRRADSYLSSCDAPSDDAAAAVDVETAEKTRQNDENAVRLAELRAFLAKLVTFAKSISDPRRR
jgi:hypothetical protein